MKPRFGDIYESRATKMRVMVIGPSTEKAATGTSEVIVIDPGRGVSFGGAYGGYKVGARTRASLGSWRRIED